MTATASEPQAFPASVPGLGSLPDSGGGDGFDGIPGRIGDLLGGLFNPPELSGGDVSPDPLPDNVISDQPGEDQPGEDQPGDGEPDEGGGEKPADDTACGADPEDPKTEDPKTEDPKTEDPKTEEAKPEDPKTEAVEVAPVPVPAPGPAPVAVPSVAAEGGAATLAPCEIAADELPQAGR
jgi:hypothetical protein